MPNSEGHYVMGRSEQKNGNTAAPYLSGLKCFGCIAYTHSLEGKSKLWAKKNVFVGYPKGVTRYKIWLIEDQKCIISRNIIFKEDHMFKESSSKINSCIEVFDRLLTNQTLSLDVAGYNSEIKIQGVDTEDKDNISEERSDYIQEATYEKENLSDYQLARDRSRRETHDPIRLEDYQVYLMDEDIAGYSYWL